MIKGVNLNNVEVVGVTRLYDILNYRTLIGVCNKVWVIYWISFSSTLVLLDQWVCIRLEIKTMN